MKVILRGDVDASDVEEKIRSEQADLATRDFQTSIQAQIKFNSDISSFEGLQEALDSGNVPTEDLLDIINQMPEFARQASELGLTISDYDLDGMVDGLEDIQRAVGNTKLDSLQTFLGNKTVQSAQKLSSIVSTSLRGVTAADYKLKSGALYNLLSGGGKTYSSEAVRCILDPVDPGFDLTKFSAVNHLCKGVAGSGR